MCPDPICIVAAKTMENSKVRVEFFQWVDELKFQRQICSEANEAYVSSAWELSKILGGTQAPYMTVLTKSGVW